MVTALEPIRAFAQGILSDADDEIVRCGVTGAHVEAAKAAVARDLLALLDSLPPPTGWEMVHAEDIGRPGPTTRRLAVPGGWLYQVEHHMHMEPIEAKPGHNCYGWHAPVFVSDPESHAIALYEAFIHGAHFVLDHATITDGGCGPSIDMPSDASIEEAARAQQ